MSDKSTFINQRLHYYTACIGLHPDIALRLIHQELEIKELQELRTQSSSVAEYVRKLHNLSKGKEVVKS